nr:NAD-dependent epimerase/dehydratase family protein [Dyella sp. ASV24]
MGDRVLVLGAGGFVGQHLVKTLVDRGDKVIAVYRQEPDSRFGEAETVVNELNEPEHFTPLLEQSRAVVHLASRSTPGSSAGEALAELHNLQPTLTLLQALQKQPQVRLLYVSSGGSLYASHEARVSTEDTGLSPRSYHGAGKVAAEYFLQAWAQQFNGAATILRPSNIYGPGQAGKPGFGIIPTAMACIQQRRTLPIWGDGQTVRDYLYIDDFIDLCVRAIDSPQSPGSMVVNAASGVPTSINELLATMEEVTGLMLDKHYETQRTVDASRIVMSAERAKHLYDWSHKVDLREGLRQTWEWFNTYRH